MIPMQFAVFTTKENKAHIKEMSSVLEILIKKVHK